MKKMLFVVIVAACLIIPAIVWGEEEAQVQTAKTVTVKTVTIDSGAEETVFSYTPQDFESIEVVERGISYAPHRFQVRGILNASPRETWNKFMRENKGRSIKVLIDDEVVRDTTVIVSDLGYLPLGSTTQDNAYARAKKLTGSPRTVNLFSQDEAAVTQGEERDVNDARASERQEGLSGMDIGNVHIVDAQ